MSIPVYPSLSADVSIDDFGHIPLVNIVHRITTPSGRIITRPLDIAADVPVKYGINYPAMTNTEKIILETWERDEAEYGGVTFSWTNPQTSVAYNTKLAAPFVYKIHPKSGGGISQLLWVVSADFIILSEI